MNVITEGGKKNLHGFLFITETQILRKSLLLISDFFFILEMLARTQN